MKARINLKNVNPGITQAMLGLERQVTRGKLETRLLDLVRMRASQINGCACCLDMHSKDARAAGARSHVPDEVYERVRQQFSEDELAHLSLAIVAINGRNRLNVAAQTFPATTCPTGSRRHTHRADRRSPAGRRTCPRSDQTPAPNCARCRFQWTSLQTVLPDG